MHIGRLNSIIRFRKFKHDRDLNEDELTELSNLPVECSEAFRDGIWLIDDVDLYLEHNLPTDTFQISKDEETDFLSA